MLKKICAYVGCNTIIPAAARYCECHQNAYNHEIRRTVDRQYDDFYHSKEWRRVQEIIMRKYHGLCVYSYVVEHKVVKAQAVHHIVELRVDFSKRLIMSNLIPVSAEVHDGKIRKWYADDKSKTVAQAILIECLDQWNGLFTAFPGGI